jgi:hypothetical protein
MGDLRNEEPSELPYGSGLSFITRVKLYFNTVNRHWFIGRVFILSLAIGAGWWGFLRPWIHNTTVLKVIDSLIGICVIVLWGGLGLFRFYRRRTPNAIYVPAKYRKTKEKPWIHWWFLLLMIIVILSERDILLEMITRRGFWEQIWQSPLSPETITILETILLASSQLFLSIAFWPWPAHFGQSATRRHGRVIKGLVCMGMSVICLLAFSVLVIWTSTSGLKSYSWRTLRFAKSMLLVLVGLAFLIISLLINDKIMRQRSQRRRAAKQQEVTE